MNSKKWKPDKKLRTIIKSNDYEIDCNQTLRGDTCFLAAKGKETNSLVCLSGWGFLIVS